MRNRKHAGFGFGAPPWDTPYSQLDREMVRSAFRSMLGALLCDSQFDVVALGAINAKYR